MTKKRQLHLRVPVLPTEAQQIKRNAHDTGLSVAKYLRQIGLGYRVSSVIDHRQVERLLKMNGDLGRLGGLLKLWLSHGVRTKVIGKAKLEDTLSAILATQTAMLQVIVALKQRRVDFSS